MHPNLYGTILVACLVTGGCEADRVTQVRDKAVELCGYMPAAASVTAMFNDDPTIQNAAVAAQLICTAVVAWHNQKMITLLQPDACPKVGNVCIEGEWK